MSANVPKRIKSFLILVYDLKSAKRYFGKAYKLVVNFNLNIFKIFFTILKKEVSVHNIFIYNVNISSIEEQWSNGGS